MDSELATQQVFAADSSNCHVSVFHLTGQVSHTIAGIRTYWSLSSVAFCFC